MAGGNCTINMGSCQKCGKCQQVCPHGAILKNGETFWIDHALCNGCMICKNTCPHYAISFTPDSDSNLGKNEPTGISSW